MLRPSDLKPLHEGTRVIGAFNPGVVKDTDDGVTYLVVRVVEEPLDVREDAWASPRIVGEDEGGGDGGIEIDWIDKADVDLSDPRVYHVISTGLIRLRFISHLRVYVSKDGRTIDKQIGTIYPEGQYEVYGIEDPRITRIGERFYMTYVAVSEHGAATALMSTKDFRSFERHGVILPPDNKDVILFPELIDGKYVAMHRPMPSLRLTKPEIWLGHSKDLKHWGEHEQLMGSRESVYRDRIGGGTPPVRMEMGYLSLYHGSDKQAGEEGVGVYTAGAFVMDKVDPRRVVARTAKPIMRPEEDYELRGFVNNVVFPTAVVEEGDMYLIYYGAADENVGVTAFKKEDLHRALQLV
ncbi:glycoside hydrolase family 130 protein [Poriferisphaera corsica]|nr:hypothetical protein [Poriferisphaera corsica]